MNISLAAVRALPTQGRITVGAVGVCRSWPPLPKSLVAASEFLDISLQQILDELPGAAWWAGSRWPAPDDSLVGRDPHSLPPVAAGAAAERTEQFDREDARAGDLQPHVLVAADLAADDAAGPPALSESVAEGVKVVAVPDGEERCGLEGMRHERRHPW